MATSETTPLTSYNALREAHKPVLFTPGTRRLFWTLDGPLTTAVQVMEEAWKPDSLEPYFRESADGSSWHPISEEPLTNPKVSSVRVHVYELEQWPDDWIEAHRGHVEDVEFGPAPDGYVWDPEDDPEASPNYRLMCCGTRRPIDKNPELEVKPTVSGKEFVTVHDYVSAVHPWLLSLREDISWAINVFEADPLPADTKLMVNYTGLRCLMIEEAALWMNEVRDRPH